MKLNKFGFWVGVNKGMWMSAVIALSDSDHCHCSLSTLDVGY